MYALGCLALAATVASCGSNANKKAAADSTATAQAQAPAEDEGWTVIFDGKTLDGWRGYDKTGVPAAWTVEDGAIKINGSGMGEAGAQDGGDLIYANKKFKNFELEFEYKVDKGANSGVFYLAQEIPGQPIFISAPEYQVLDNANHPDAKLGVDGNRQSASLYDMIPAKPQNAKPFGEWNTAKIMVYNGTVVHYQNGEQVSLVDPAVERDARQEQVQQGKMARSLRPADQLRRREPRRLHRPAGPRRQRLVPQHPGQGTLTGRTI